MDMWKTIGDFIGEVGFPIFVAAFVLVRLDPAIRRLTTAITSNTVVTAKSNGMKAKDVREIIKLVEANKHKRRQEDRIDFGDDVDSA